MSVQNNSSATFAPAINLDVTSTPSPNDVNCEGLATNSQSGSSKLGTRRKTLKKRSKVWDHFTSFIDEEEDWLRTSFSADKIDLEEDLSSLEQLEADVSKLALDPTNDM